MRLKFSEERVMGEPKKIWRVRSEWNERMVQASNMEVALRKYKRSVKAEMGTALPKKDYEPTEAAFVGCIR